MKTSTVFALMAFLLMAFLLGTLIWLDEPKQSISRMNHVECADGLSGFVDIYGRKFCAAKPVQ